MGSTYGPNRDTMTSESSGAGYLANANETQKIMREYALLPLKGAQLPKDVQANINGFDQWIRSLTGGKLTLSDLEMVMSAVPVLGNLLAAADVLTGLYELSQKQDEANLVEWFGIGIDALGVIPAPGLATTRIAMRPVLGLARQAIAHHKGDIAEAVLTVVVNHLLTDLKLADKVEKAVDDLAAELKPLLQDVCGFLNDLLEQFATFLHQIATGHLGIYRPAGRAKYQPGRNFRSPEQEKGFFASVLSFHARAQMAVVNSALQLALTDAMQAELLGIARYLRQDIKPQINQRIMALAEAGTKGSIAWLLKTISERLLHRKGRVKATGAANTNGRSVVEYRHVDASIEKQRKLQPVKRNPNACKVCPTGKPGTNGQVGGAVQLGLGNETFSHTDFVLPGVMPVVWTRSYNSRLTRFDDGMLGARWLTPFHTRFELQDAELIHIDAQGRELDYPLLKVGEHHQDRSEGLMLSRLDEKLLSVTRGHELLELYELRGERFLLSLLRDRAGNQIVLDYDAAGRMTRLRSGDGPWVLVQTDAAGRIEKLTQTAVGDTPARVLAQYRYDDAGDLIAATDENGHQREYRYQNHLVTRYTDRTGRGMNLEWNGREASARVIREYADDGSSELLLEYVEHLRLTIVTNALGHATYYYMDESGYPYRTVYPDGGEEWLLRDDHKNLLQHIHSDGSQESFVYDERDNLIEHVRADASIVRMQYDDKDQLIKITDPNGEEWLREYDAKGNLVKETDPLGHCTQYAYNAQGLPVEIKDAKGGSKKLAYTDTGLLLSYTDCSSKTSRWTYDERGRIKAAQDAAGGVTRYQYGAAGQLEKVIQPDTTEIKLEYDAEGRLLTHIDALDRTTRYAYDRAGRISGRTDAAGQQLNYAYDKLNQLITLTNENRDSYRFEYDVVGRLLSERDFAQRETQYQYDAGSGRLAQINEAVQITTLAYDNAGRLIERASGTSRERFKYDAFGRIYAAKNQFSECRFQFDAVGNLIGETHDYRLFGQRQQFTWAHEYDALGNRIASIRPDGQRTDWLTYGSGHVHGVLWNGQEIASFERDNLHREVSRTLGNQLAATQQYDKMGRLTQQTLAGKTSQTRSYQYDVVGQLLGINDSRSGATSYKYDPVGRLIAAASPHAKETFAFDPASNIVNMGGSIASQSNGNNLPSNIPAIVGNLLKEYAGTHFKYDARGNLIEKQQGTQVQKLAWDGFNRLAALETPNGKTEYAYDVFGRRIGKRHNGQTTTFVWDGDVIAQEKTAEQTRHYLFETGSFVPLAQVVEKDGGSNTAYYHVDHLGTPQLLTDANGEIAWSADYKAWGAAKAAISDAARSSGLDNPLRFQGQYFDAESGLHYNRHRYYDPETGRFISSDPIGLLGGLNTHAYAPNPVHWIDPMGLCGKPANSPVMDKWLGKGGTVWQDIKDKTWVYQDWDGNIVRYPNGYPDFSGYERQRVDVPDLRGDHSKASTGDFGKADKLASKGAADYENNTWHHNENGVTMQEVPKKIHNRFTHCGGVSNIKKGK